MEHGTYDAILLDVDNGPGGLTRKGNNWLYSQAGLEAAFATLRSAGVLAVWSASPDRVFAQRLCEAGFDVDEVHVRSRGRRRGARHTIWLAVAVPHKEDERNDNDVSWAVPRNHYSSKRADTRNSADRRENRSPLCGKPRASA